MNYWTGSIIFTIAVIGLLSWIVFSRIEIDLQTGDSLFFNIALVSWSCCVILLMSVKDVIHLLFLLKIISIVGAFLPAAFIFFIAGFEIGPDGNESRQLKLMQMVYFVLAIISSLTVFHPSFIKSIIIRDKIFNNLPGPEVIYGFPFKVYSGIIIISMVSGFRYLYGLIHKRTGTQKTEVQYIFLATVAGTIFAIFDHPCCADAWDYCSMQIWSIFFNNNGFNNCLCYSKAQNYEYFCDRRKNICLCMYDFNSSHNLCVVFSIFYKSFPDIHIRIYFIAGCYRCLYNCATLFAR